MGIAQWVRKRQAKQALRNIERYERQHKTFFGYANKVQGWKVAEEKNLGRLLRAMTQAEFLEFQQETGYGLWN